MENNFNMWSQTRFGASLGTRSSCASSAHDDFTPTSRRPSPTDVNLGIDDTTLTGSHLPELTPPSQSMLEPMFDPAELETLLFPSELHTSLVATIEGMASPNYDHMPEENATSQLSMGSVASPGRYPMCILSPKTAIEPTFSVVTPIPCLSGFEGVESFLWGSCAEDSPPFSHHQVVGFNNIGDLDWERHSQSSLKRYQRLRRPSPEILRTHRTMTVHRIQRHAKELQLAQMKPPRNGSSGNNSAIAVARRAMCTCDYPGCHKAFCRKEHLKRHKQTVHGEGPNSFSCEFCGKDQFNRWDNLKTHRKLHARPNRRNRGVSFVPAAVHVIEQEQRSQRRRAPAKSKPAGKQGDDF